MAEEKRRRKKKRKNKPLMISLIVVGVLLLGIVGYAAKVYFDIKGTADKAYQPTEELVDADGNKIESLKDANLKQGDPITILLLGVDTGDLGRLETGRSDSMMVATVNPSMKKTTITSIPRDTYTEIVGHGTSDKINHSYAFGGVAMAAASVSQMLDIPINYYVSINMKGIQEIVDEVGGVDVNNSFEFTYEGMTFPAGTQHLNGDAALKYSRMRYDDPEGDYGRQERQRQVLTAIIKKLASLSTLTQYNDLLQVLGDNCQTNVTWGEITTLFTSYRSAFDKIVTDQLHGTGFTGDGVTGESGISYQMVSADELHRVSTNMQKALKKE